MAGFLWGLGIGFVAGCFLIGVIVDALVGEEDGFCHCLQVRNERMTTDGICDTCGRMADPLEMSMYGTLSSRTELRNAG